MTSMMLYVIWGMSIFVGTVLGEVVAYIIVPPQREGNLRLFEIPQGRNSRRFLSGKDHLVC